MFRERIQRTERESNTEGTENNLGPPQRSESEFVVIEGTETSPTKILAVLQVAGGKEATVGETEGTNKECMIVRSEKCLMSSIDEASEGLEKFLRDKLNSFSCEGLDRIVEVDLSVVLELLYENLVDRGGTGSNVVPADKEKRRNHVDNILRSDLKEKNIGSASKRSMCDVDANAAGERPSKSVAFQFDNAGGILSSARCELIGVLDAGQSFPSSSRPDDTHYGTSELESIARRRVDDVSGRMFHEGAGTGLPCSSGTTEQHGLGTGR